VPLLMHWFGPNRSTKTLQQTYAQQYDSWRRRMQ
jgi:hypothetical protein